MSLSDKIHQGALRGNVLARECPSREVLQHVTSRWGVLVLIALQKGTLRFAELRRLVGGVSDRMLAQTLQLLEKDGFILRTDHQEVPPRVDYSLTPTGHEVAERVRVLVDWIEDNITDILQNRPDQAA